MVTDLLLFVYLCEIEFHYVSKRIRFLFAGKLFQ